MGAMQNQLNADTTRINSLVTTMGTVLTDVQTIKSADANTIQSLKDQLATALANNTPLDFSQFEAGLTALENNTGTVLSAVAPAIPATAQGTPNIMPATIANPAPQAAAAATT